MTWSVERSYKDADKVVDDSTMLPKKDAANKDAGDAGDYLYSD